MYGKATETAIAAMSRLAEIWDDKRSRLSAVEIADSRGLQRPFVAKVLTALSQAGLVEGSRGPGGGFSLARDPKDISLYDVYVLFERPDDSDLCPFGGGICGTGTNCALHDKLVGVQDSISEVLNKTTFEEFRIAFQENGLRPARMRNSQKKKRDSYRAAASSRRSRR